MSFCPKCRASLGEAAQVCPSCGHSLGYPHRSPFSPALPPGAAERPGGQRRCGTGGTTPNAELTAMARDALRGRWGEAIGASVIYLLIITGIQMAPYVGGPAMLILGGAFSLGFHMYFLAFSRHENARMGQLFEGFNHFGSALSAYLLMLLWIVLWSLLLIIPGIIAALAYSQLFFVLSDSPDTGAAEALRKSKALMHGRKAKLFVLGLRFLGWALLCVLTLGIGFLWYVPYFQTTLAKFYDDLLPPASSPEVAAT